MHFHATATICPLLLLLLPLASARCYKKGSAIENANVQFALDNVEQTAAFLQGNLQSNQERGTCVSDDPAGNHWYFAVRYEGSTGKDVSKAMIIEGLRQEVNGCGKRGGRRKIGDMVYTYV